MVRILKAQAFEDGKLYIEGACAEDDNKPMDNIVTGSKMIEVDTGDVYMFMEGDDPSWCLVQAGPAEATLPGGGDLSAN